MSYLRPDNTGLSLAPQLKYKATQFGIICQLHIVFKVILDQIKQDKLKVLIDLTTALAIGSCMPLKLSSLLCSLIKATNIAIQLLIMCPTLPKVETLVDNACSSADYFCLQLVVMTVLV